jgi:hypothetical protein
MAAGSLGYGTRWALCAALLTACGASNTTEARNPEPIPSMPAYPKERAEAPPKAAGEVTGASKRVAEICAGASPIVDDKKLGGADLEKWNGGLARRFGSHASLAKESKYSLGDLKALEKKQSWEELLSHAEDVPPTQRDASWDKAVEHAAVGYLQSLKSDRESFEGVFGSRDLLRRYPHLEKSKDFLSQRAGLGKLAAEECFRSSYGGGRCVELMRDFLLPPEPAPEVAFAFGKLTRKNQNHYIAVPFFKWAFERKPEASWCRDDDLRMAVLAGLGLPPDDEGAVGARQITGGVCWATLSGQVEEELRTQSQGYYRDNVCAVLRAKGAV